MRSGAYREFIHLVYGRVGKNRIPLSACAYHAIRTKFQTKEKNDGRKTDDATVSICVKLSVCECQIMSKYTICKIPIYLTMYNNNVYNNNGSKLQCQTKLLFYDC